VSNTWQTARAELSLKN